MADADWAFFDPNPDLDDEENNWVFSVQNGVQHASPSLR